MKTNNYLIEYYEAFELLLGNARDIFNEHRTHFGVMDKPSSNYCWFKAIEAKTNPEMSEEARKSMDTLHELLFKDDLSNQHILDVGFGTAGTLKKVAQQFPNAYIDGINLNSIQFDIAQKHIENQTNTKLHLGDFYEYKFDKQFDLLYFIESAFHMNNKELLVKKITDRLKPNGSVYIVDIFIPERFWKRVEKKKSKEDIFDYLSISKWEELFNKNGLKINEFKNITQSVANHITINISETDFLNEIVEPFIKNSKKPQIYRERLIDAYNGYKRLSKLFSKEMLHYGIIKATRNS